MGLIYLRPLGENFLFVVEANILADVSATE